MDIVSSAQMGIDNRFQRFGNGGGEFFQFSVRTGISTAGLDRVLRFVRGSKYLIEINWRPMESHVGPTVSEVIPVVAKQLASACRRAIVTAKLVLDLEIEGTAPADSKTPWFSRPGTSPGRAMNANSVE